MQNYVIECTNNETFIKTLESASVQLVVTSPPYNLNKAYEQKITMDHYLEQQANIITECVRVLKPNGSICWQVGNYLTKDKEIIPLDLILYPIFKSLGLILCNRIVWHYGHGLHNQRRFSGRYEVILWFAKSNDYVFNLDPVRVPSKYPGKRYFKGPRVGQLSGNPLGKNPSDVWNIPNVKNNHPEKTIHPCQFPIELVERLVLALTNPNDIVFDPYVGVGSTMLAALKHDRQAYGCDIHNLYVSITQERINALANGTLPMRPMGKPIFEP